MRHLSSLLTSFLLALALIISGGCGGGSRGTGITVDGELKSKITGLPIANARVRIGATGQEITTDENGRFRITVDERSSDLTLDFTVDGQEASFTITDIPPDAEVAEATFFFDPNNGTVEAGDIIFDGNGGSKNPTPKPTPRDKATPKATPVDDTPQDEGKPRTERPTPTPNNPGGGNTQATPTETPKPNTPDEVQEPVLNGFPSRTNSRALTLRGAKSAQTGISFNGSEASAIDSSATWEATFELSEGENIIRIAAFNQKGTKSAIVRAEVFLDTSLPRLEAFSVESVSSNEATITFSSNENTQAAVAYSTGSQDPVVKTAPSDGSSHRITLDNLLAESTYNLTFFLKDAVGNEAIIEGRTLTTTPITQPAQSLFFLDDRLEIGSFNLERGTQVRHTAFQGNPSFIVYDPQDKMTFWIEQGTGKIIRAPADGSSHEELLVFTREQGIPSTLAIDTVSRKLYFFLLTRFYTDHVTPLEYSSRLYRSNLDGSELEPLSYQTKGIAGGLAVDPIERKLYLTDLLTRVMLKMNLDGSNPTEFYSAPIDPVLGYPFAKPKGVVVDSVARKVIWTEYGYYHVGNVLRSNTDGSNREVLYTARGIPSVVAINKATQSAFVCWSDSGRDSIERINLTDSTTVRILNPEFNRTFSGIAVETETGDLLLTALNPIRDRLIRMGADGTNYRSFMTDFQFSAADFAVDPKGGKLYWKDTTHEAVYRANLDGSQREKISTSLQNVGGGAIALDTKTGYVYWSDDIGGPDYGARISRARLDGSNAEVIMTFNDSSQFVRDMQLDLVNNKLYVSANGLWRSNLDGSDKELLFDGTVFDPGTLAINPEGRHLYWLNHYGLDKRVMETNLDGTNPRALATDQEGISGLAYDSATNALYWSVTNSKFDRDLVKFSLADSSSGPATYQVGWRPRAIYSPPRASQ